MLVFVIPCNEFILRHIVFVHVLYFVLSAIATAIETRVTKKYTFVLDDDSKIDVENTVKEHRLLSTFIEDSGDLEFQKKKSKCIDE